MAPLWGLLAGRFLSIFVLAKIIEIMSSVDSPAKTLPRILITNDDGIGAKGLRFLLSCVADMGRVRVVAPDSHRSGQSGAITSGVPLTLQPVAPVLGAECYSCNGTPVDCVKLGYDLIFADERPALNLSGINHGSNSAVSILYSGTMGAAIEASFYGAPSIGLSLTDHSEDADFDASLEFARKLVGDVLAADIREPLCLNVNIPVGRPEQIRGWRICRQNGGYWKETFVCRKAPHGKDYYWLTGDFCNTEPDATDTDEWALAHGYISIVPVHIDLTNYRQMPLLERIIR